MAASGLQGANHAHLCQIAPQAWKWTREQVVAQV